MFNSVVSKADVRMVASFFLAGQGYSEYRDLFHSLVVPCQRISKDRWYRIQKSFILESVERVWLEEIQRVMNDLKRNHLVVLVIDGRFSRSQKKKGPAKYCTVVVIEHAMDW
jgi:hypothetical protein